MKTIWNWLTQFAHSYAIATILVVIVSLWLNSHNQPLVILEMNDLIRKLEIIGGIISLIVIGINFFTKWGRMAESDE